MELRHLRYFVVVAETLNFTLAARQLRVAQPALSRQIQALEREIGVRLFERGGTKTALTVSGTAFLAGAQATLNAATDAIRRARDASASALTTLRLGYVHPHFDHLVSLAIAEFHKTYPKVTVVPSELSPARQAEAILQDELDLGLIGLPWEAERHGLVHEPFMPPAPLLAALPKGHRLTKRRVLTLMDYDGEKIIPISDKTFPGATARVARGFREAGVRFTMLPAAETSTSILGQVAAGVGVAVVPDILRRTAPAGIVFRPFEGNLVVQYEAAWKAERYSPAIAAFLAALRSLDVIG
jgi:DNA-binding transcriptional LysR family regulator